MIEAARSSGSSAPETRVARRKRETRDRIFHTALDLFVDQGLDETTVAEIARAADIGKGTFFTYYPTKECVFVDVNREIVHNMEKALDRAAAAGKALESRIRAFFMPGIRWHGANPVLSRHMLAAFMRDVAYMRADRDNSLRMQERLTRELTAAQAAGRLRRSVPVAEAAAAITSAYFGSLGIWHVSEMKSRLAADFTRSLHIVFRGLKS